MAKNIVLTGFMMAGKSSVGRELSRLTKRIMLDSDDEIIKREGCSINDIFACRGEEYFRRVESEVIAELSAKSGIIISTGGGAVLRKENVAALRKNGVIINIKITPEVIKKRLAGERANRPLIKDADLEDILKRLADREKYYADCDYCVSASDTKSPLEQAEEILGILKENGEI